MTATYLRFAPFGVPPQSPHIIEVTVSIAINSSVPYQSSLILDHTKSTTPSELKPSSSAASSPILANRKRSEYLPGSEKCPFGAEQLPADLRAIEINLAERFEPIT
jgi:hypothetical protein